MRRVLVIGGESPGSQSAIAATAMSEAFAVLAGDIAEAHEILSHENL